MPTLLVEKFFWGRKEADFYGESTASVDAFIILEHFFRVASGLEARVGKNNRSDS